MAYYDFSGYTGFSSIMAQLRANNNRRTTANRRRQDRRKTRHNWPASYQNITPAQPAD
jgi:hypothetical protein